MKLFYNDNLRFIANSAKIKQIISKIAAATQYRKQMACEVIPAIPNFPVIPRAAIVLNKKEYLSIVLHCLRNGSFSSHKNAIK